jgi:hypothetical protein
MHSRRERGGGLFLVSTGERVATKDGTERAFRIWVCTRWHFAAGERPTHKAEATLWAQAQRRARHRMLRLEFKALRTAFLFSLMSVFDIGFEGWDGGRWIRMLQPRQFDIRARGWTRVLSGVQSLLGVGLLALSILSYFGHPFE